MEELAAYPQVDILEYPILERVGNKHKEHLLTFAPKEYQSPIDYWFAERTYLHTYACNKVFKRNLFEKILFPQGKTFEDVLTIPKLIGIVPFHNNEYVKPIIRITDKGRYLYYWNSNSITAKAKAMISSVYTKDIIELCFMYLKNRIQQRSNYKIPISNTRVYCSDTKYAHIYI